MDDAALFELRGIVKTYANGVTALRGVDLTVRHGEVHAVVGENGAGKSTLLKIAFGLEAATAGTLLIDGNIESHPSPASAAAAGIGMVHQHVQLCPSLTVAENLALGHEPRRRGLLSRRSMRAAAAQFTVDGPALDPDAKVATLGVGDRQRLELAKALRDGPRLLILDEPTAVLTPDEGDALVGRLRRLAATGTGVVLITHKLREVLAVADHVTVLRAGAVTLSESRAGLDEATVVRAMVGSDVVAPVAAPSASGPVRLRLANVSTGGSPRRRLVDVSLDVHGGEIVGIAGVDGNGQDALVEAITGLRPATAGAVLLDGDDITRWPVSRRRRHGVAHIPNDRMTRGAMLTRSIADNVVADRAGDAPFSNGGILDRQEFDKAGNEAIDQFDIRANDPATIVGGLSGGNIQKVVVARELAGSPALIVAAHPTRGVDVRAMVTIHEALLAQRAAGAAVLLVSAELDELRRLSDRIIVFASGRSSGEFAGDAAVADIGAAMVASP